MIWWIIFIACVVCFAFGCLVRRQDEKWSDANTASTAISGALGILLLILFGGTTEAAIKWRIQLIRIDRDLVVLAQREAHLVKTVKDSVSQYPLEESFLNKLSPALLLKLPEIKSNHLLQTQIEALLEIQDCIYTKRLEQNLFLVKLECIRIYRWIHPAIMFPPPMEPIETKGAK